MGMEGRTAVRPSGITPDFHAAFKQTWYKANLGGCYRYACMLHEVSHLLDTDRVD